MKVYEVPLTFAEYDSDIKIKACTLKPLHYGNTPMQYTAIFHGCKNDNFQVTKCYIFHICAQNIDCGYTLESPQ